MDGISKCRAERKDRHSRRANSRGKVRETRNKEHIREVVSSFP